MFPPQLTRTAACLAGLVATLSSCGDGATVPTVVRLSRGFEPQFQSKEPVVWSVPLGDTTRRVEFVPPSSGSTEPEISWRVRSNEWDRVAARLYRTIRPLPGLGRSTSPAGRAWTEGLDGRRIDEISRGRFGRALLAVQDEVDQQLIQTLSQTHSSDAVGFAGEYLWFWARSEEQAPPELLAHEVLDVGGRFGEHWQVPLTGLLADGIPLYPGFAQSTPEIPASARVVQFVVATIGRPSSEPARFSIELDGQRIFECEQTVGPELTTQNQRAVLPERHKAAPLVMRVEGPACQAAILAPRCVPEEIGRYGARPGPSDVEQQNMLLFSADTFRADNLAAYGGLRAIAPELNEFAAECVVFRQARSPSSWTFPAHAALFSGLYPTRAGTVSRSDVLADEVTTLAEHFADHGYRTIAITERGYVSRNLGLAQGFEWFEEWGAGLELTLQRTFERLADDDGRPLFLFVHSYRAHHPYEIDDVTRERLGIEDKFHELAQRLPTRERPDRRIAREKRVRLERLYRGASADLSRGFEVFRQHLITCGLYDHATLVFTSDHGEAFYEHGVGQHGCGVWDELLRVPLLIRAPGLAAGTRDGAASLVDIPRTMSRLAGLEPHPDWGGEDLMTFTGQRTIYAFQCSNTGPPNHVAIIEGSYKLVTTTDERSTTPGDAVELAYDLEGDPREQTDVRTADWVAPLYERRRASLTHQMQALYSGRAKELSSEQAAQLEALGYGGD